MSEFHDQLIDVEYEKAWMYVESKYRQAKRRFAMEVVASWVADTVFFICAGVLCYGVILTDFPIDKQFTQSFAQSLSVLIPPLQSVWERYSQWLLGLETEVRTMQLLSLALTVLIPVACAVPAALLTGWIKRPKRPEPPQGTRQEKAKAMLETAQKAKEYTKRAGHSGMGFYGTLFALVIGTFLAYVLLGTPVGGQILEEINRETGKAIVLWIVGMFVTYGVLCWAVRLLTTPLYFCYVPKWRLKELKRHYRRVTEMEKSNAEAPAQPQEKE